MLKAHIQFINLREWFPPRDPLATCVARLLILREDFLLELKGIEAHEIPQLDLNEDKWRRMYFLRRSILTLSEIRSSLETLQVQPEFKRMLLNQPPAKQADFKKLLADFNQAHAVVRDIRNAIGGHILQDRVQGALDKMSSNRSGILEVGPKVHETHFKFVGELLVAILVGDLLHAKIENDLQTIANLLPSLPLIEEIFAMYVESRGLL